MKAILILILLAGALLAACGSSKKADTVPGNAPAQADSATARASAPASTGAEAPPPNSDKLQPLLLQLSDMPSGYSPTTSDSSSTAGICNGPSKLSDVIDLNETGRASVEFEASQFGPIVSHEIASYSTADAKKAMGAVRQIFSACSSWTETDATDGSKTTWKLAPLSFPSFGDETFAFRMSTTDIPLFGAAQVNAAFFRRAGILEAVLTVTLGPQQGPDLEGLVRKADSKLQANPFH